MAGAEVLITCASSSRAYGYVLINATDSNHNLTEGMQEIVTLNCRSIVLDLPRIACYANGLKHSEPNVTLSRQCNAPFYYQM